MSGAGGDGTGRARGDRAPGALRELHLHFDPVSGIAGDMAVAALVDAGVPRGVIVRAVGAMKVPGLRVGFERRRRGGLAGTGFVVRWPDRGGHVHAHRDYAEIRRLLRRSSLDARARAIAGDVFERLARVEGDLHGVPLDRVTFHEVGAFDSIADVVAAAAAMAWLAPISVTSSPPVVGTGRVHTAHGELPVPAPATAGLLRGLPIRAEGAGELTTPTGAALLATVVDAFGAPPPMRIVAQGFGAGTRELGDRPNALRVLLGEPIGRAEATPPEHAVLVEANIDDMSPQLVEPLVAALFVAGALDAWTTSIAMKKGRPGIAVSALAPPAAVPAVERAFFEHSTTLGVRRTSVARTVLGRATARVRTAFGPVSVKIASLDGRILGATPEFEDCRRLAARRGVPIRTVLAAAAAAGAALLTGAGGRRGA